MTYGPRAGGPTRTAILLDESAKQVVAERLDEIEEIAVVRDQEAIPWCTTHDNIECDGAEYPTCWARIHGETEGDVCVISHGGPDHKWWKDT